ncbi:alpha-L-arabinofuranosidase C-terminal domain-containing protein [Paenibacillus sp. NFR01]|uniref:alpha-L-arabinofuranosidase C-terminal domain-containing protein n=1 Tax=Paenibacillus sp. NFR01 TaxID=1566279 RepID=UPI0008CED427|nr:alpha-L-arabinofuranosidase C-terminal domain-containing protein [Paenibacillus sp. NFR01]SET21698.1 Alpha-L-arabinofuranosidase [Paenibacillus sp. NFR01]
MNNTQRLTIHTGQKGAALGDLFGIFFEDINHAADGGLYAELVQNRSFEFDPIDRADYHVLTAWELVERSGGKASLTVESEASLHPKNPHYAVLDIGQAGEGVGLSNAGFGAGIPVVAEQNYRFSMYARRDESHAEPVVVTVENPNGEVAARAEIIVDSTDWEKYEVVLSASVTAHDGKLILLTGGTGRLYLDMVSLFPLDTYKNRPNGLRRDIAELLADLKPKFMRFPGGCLIHDGSLDPDDRDSMYRWKNTLGPAAARPSKRNNWGYNQTLGLGYYEYFLFCEDIGAKAIPVLPGGYDPHHRRIVPIDELGPWIQDALDLIEFARGDASTTWGAVRAEMGHPEPFGLEYIGIGNEEVGDPFFERYPYFHRAIKAQYPDIKVINSSGPFAAGGEYERGWASARENGSDLVDEHYYSSPEWFLAHADRYAGFDANGPKVFLGEYATWGNTYYNALAEAAYMTGLERSAHAVSLACYAPMLCNVDYINWKPDMIWFNNHEVFGTPNYYVQQLFMRHQGDHLLQVEAEGLESEEVSENAPIAGSIALLADHAEVFYRDIVLIDRKTGTEQQLGSEIKLNCSLEAQENGTAQRELQVGAIDTSSYTLKLKATKFSGVRGFNIVYGMQDEQNRLVWEIGGWQNQDTILSSFVSGRGSVLTHSLFTVETGREYELVLEVEGRTIRAYIDGVLVNEAEDKLPVIKPLYYSASLEEASGDVIVKAVNMQEQAVRAALELADLPPGPLTVEVHELSGHELSDENSFEEPMRVHPKVREFQVEANAFEYDFPARSLTVLRVKRG